MFCLGGQTLIPCRAPRCSTTKTRGHPPILSTSSPRSLSTRYAFIPPAPRVWVMLLFIKPSFVNELNEGEAWGPLALTALHPGVATLPRPCLIFNPFPSPPFARPFLSWRGHELRETPATAFGRIIYQIPTSPCYEKWLCGGRIVSLDCASRERGDP